MDRPDRPERFPPGSRVYIGGIDYPQVTPEDLEEKFSQYGELQEFKYNKTYAFAQYRTKAEAERAIANEKNTPLGRKRLEVAHARGDPNRRRERLQERTPRDRRSPQRFDNRPRLRDSRDFGNERHDSFRRKRSRSPSPGDFSARKRRAQVAVRVFYLHSSLRPYADLVVSKFAEFGILADEYLVKRLDFLEEVDRATREGIRFTCLIKRNNEQSGTVSFRGLDENGKSKGVAEITIKEAVEYVARHAGGGVMPQEMSQQMQPQPQPQPQPQTVPPVPQPQNAQTEQSLKLLSDLVNMLGRQQQQQPQQQPQHQVPPPNAPPPPGQDLQSLLSLFTAGEKSTPPPPPPPPPVTGGFNAPASNTTPASSEAMLQNLLSALQQQQATQQSSTSAPAHPPSSMPAGFTPFSAGQQPFTTKMTSTPSSSQGFASTRGPELSSSSNSAFSDFGGHKRDSDSSSIPPAILKLLQSAGSNSSNN